MLRWHIFVLNCFSFIFIWLVIRSRMYFSIIFEYTFDIFMGLILLMSLQFFLVSLTIGTIFPMLMSGTTPVSNITFRTLSSSLIILFLFAYFIISFSISSFPDTFLFGGFFIILFWIYLSILYLFFVFFIFSYRSLVLFSIFSSFSVFVSLNELNNSLNSFFI
jgi:hypothetical protein